MATTSSLPFALSPLALTAVCAVVQVIAGYFVGVWAWVPTVLAFWVAIAWLLRRFPHKRPRQRFGPASGATVWSILAVLVGLMSLRSFHGHWSLLNSIELWASWLLFALVNPWFEESYWRGLVMDSTAAWGRWVSLFYSSAWFALSHPMIWGIHSLPLRKPEAVGALLFVGLVWGLAYQRTGSLRWCTAGHMLADLLGLAALVLLNAHDPTLR